jgi:predicted O-methyltransferase YrrM
MTKDDVDELINEYVVKDKFDPTLSQHNLSQLDERSVALAYSIVRSEKPKNILEYGFRTATATYGIAAGIKENGFRANFLSCEIEKDFYKTGIKRMKKLGLDKYVKFGRDVKKCLGDIPKPLDFLFIDADHTRGFAEWSFPVILPMVRPGGMVYIHDIRIESDWTAPVGVNGETQYIVDSYRAGTWPLEKLYLAWGNEGLQEFSLWRKK